MEKILLHTFIKDNHRKWDSLSAFAAAHDMSPQRLNGWIRAGALTDGKNVFSGITGKRLAVDNVILNIRGWS